MIETSTNLLAEVERGCSLANDPFTEHIMVAELWRHGSGAVLDQPSPAQPSPAQPSRLGRPGVKLNQGSGQPGVRPVGAVRPARSQAGPARNQASQESGQPGVGPASGQPGVRPARGRASKGRASMARSQAIHESGQSGVIHSGVKFPVQQ